MTDGERRWRARAAEAMRGPMVLEHVDPPAWHWWKLHDGDSSQWFAMLYLTAWGWAVSLRDRTNVGGYGSREEAEWALVTALVETNNSAESP